MSEKEINEQPAAADIGELFEAIRRYARENHQSVLELVSEYLIDDLPFNIGNAVKEYLEEHQPKVKPGQVKYWATFDSGRPDISERMKEIIYGPDPEDEA